MNNRFAPWMTTPARTVRPGHFWVPGDRVTIGEHTYQTPPMYVEWETPETIKRRRPVVLMRGGGFQGTEWFDTPDGRPGWAQRLVEAGYAVLVVDRPGHRRSPYHVDTVGPMGPPFSYEGGRQIYFPGDDPHHTQWPFDSDDEAAMDEFIAGGPIRSSSAAARSASIVRGGRSADCGIFRRMRGVDRIDATRGSRLARQRPRTDLRKKLRRGARARARLVHPADRNGTSGHRRLN